jgi:hypothetical protein
MVGEADTLSVKSPWRDATRTLTDRFAHQLLHSLHGAALNKSQFSHRETAFANFMARAPFPLASGGQLAILSPASAAALAFDRRR